MSRVVFALFLRYLILFFEAHYFFLKVDNGNLKKSKTIGGSLKKIFTIKKNSKKYEGSIHGQRPGSPSAISITVSR